jgi:6-phosphogluconate dehydrogenase
MGQNLILNMADHGFTVVAFNRTVSKVDRFLENEAKGKSIIGAHSIEEFVQKLKKPRRMMMLVQAGRAVDDFIELIITSSSLPLSAGLYHPLTHVDRRRSRTGRHHH